VEVPGKIYVCIETTEGFQIQSGGLTADSSYTTGTDPDLSISDYVGLTTGVTDTWDAGNTFQTWTTKPNLARVSFMAPSSWAPVDTTGTATPATLTIDVTAQFDPVRRLATVSASARNENEKRHLRTRRHEDQDLESPLHWGRLPESPLKELAVEAGMFFPPTPTIQAMEMASASTTVLLHGPAPATPTLPLPPTSPTVSTPAGLPELGDEVGNEPETSPPQIEPKPVLPTVSVIGGAIGGVTLLGLMAFFLFL